MRQMVAFQMNNHNPRLLAKATEILFILLHVYVLYVYFLTKDKKTLHQLLASCKGWHFLCILAKLIMQVFSPQ